MKHIFISTPVHGWDVTGAYWATMEAFKEFCKARAVRITCLPKFGMSDLILARNVAVHDFLKTDADVLLTFDSDQAAKPQDLWAICESAFVDKCVTACPVPKKHREWPEIVRLAREGHDDPDKAAAAFNFYVLPGKPIVTGPWMRVATVGAGAMAIGREQILKMCYQNPIFMVLGEPVPELYARDFVDEVDGIWPIQFSEDFSFCARAQKAGIQVWLYWPAEVQHIGTSVYRGKLTCAPSHTDSYATSPGASASSVEPTQPETT